MSEPFIGEIKIFAANFAPRGWAFCDGQLLPIAQNTALFSILGTTYGGDGETTFGMPNLQGRMPIHAGSGPDLTPRSLGEQGGTAAVTLTEAEMPAHAHSAYAKERYLKALLVDANTADPRGNKFAVADAYSHIQPDVDMHVDSFGDDIGTTGGGTAHWNMPPYLALNFVIALVGLYPTRS